MFASKTLDDCKQLQVTVAWGRRRGSVTCVKSQ